MVTVQRYVVVVPPALWPTVTAAADRYGLALHPVTGGTDRAPCYAVVVAPEVDLAALATTIADRPNRDDAALTDRQMVVLRALAAGMTDPQIARSLHLSVDTIKTHLRRLYRRLGVHTRGQAVAEGYRRRLLHQSEPGGGDGR